MPPSLPPAVAALALLVALGACTGELSGSGRVDEGPDGDVGADAPADGPADAPADAPAGGGDPAVDAGPHLEAADAADGGADPPADAPADAGPGDPAIDAPADEADVPGPDVAGADADAAAEVDAAEPAVLLERSGCFFEVTEPDELQNLAFGQTGTAYPLLVVELSVIHGGWREDVFDRDILNHNLFGLFRNSAVARERYILGVGAQISAATAGLRRRVLFFGRVDLEPRPEGQGYTSYTTFRANGPWEVGARYDMRVELDALAHQQRLHITREGAPFADIDGAIDYYDVSLTTSGWRLELSAPETDHRDVTPVGWTFCDLRVTAP